MGKRGKKNCPQCHTEVGARTLSCPNCPHIWGERKTQVYVPKGLGRGKKQCPECKTVVGSKSLSCSHCSHSWGKPKTQPKKEIVQKEGRGRRECNHCGYINGVRQQICTNCNQEIQKKEKKEVEQKEGRGRKKCNHCGYINGIKSRVCSQCKEKFEKVEKKENELPEKYKCLIDLPTKPVKHMTPDQHAQRIMKYGKDRAQSLKFLAKQNGNWNHVNWSMIK